MLRFFFSFIFWESGLYLGAWPQVIDREAVQTQRSSEQGSYEPGMATIALPASRLGTLMTTSASHPKT